MSRSIKLSLLAAAMAFSLGAIAGPNDPAGPAPLDAPAPMAATFGNVLCTAAINSTGTVAGGLAVNRDPAKTGRLATGNYQVSFLNPCLNITAARGWSRLVQVDTLSSGAIGHVTCTTADRAGDPNGVFVQCTNQTGATVDTSFFLFVLR